jgi:hypothetical protein
MLEQELPDVRDGLTRTERIVLLTLAELQRESGDRGVKMAQLYGRVVEQIDLSQSELMAIVRRLQGRSPTRNG